jgi:UTP--glucose-1-phosphate uridylyltransferase
MHPGIHEPNTMKAVIPAAGLGVRFLPVTKSQPKEMLPVVDKPVIQYVVEEAVSSGITDIIIITGRGKRAIEDHFDRAFELEHYLRSNNRTGELRALEELSSLADIHYIRQKDPLGLGHAVLCARKHINDEPFAVLLGDTIYTTDDKRPVTRQCIDVSERYNAPVIAVEKVPRNMIPNYGMVKVSPLEPGVWRIRDMVEKPAPDKSPSDLGITGTYILTPDIFDHLERTRPGRNGEIQLTDALRLLARKRKTLAFEFRGRRFDIGRKMDWFKAFFELALERPEYSSELEAFLKEKLR